MNNNDRVVTGTYPNDFDAQIADAVEDLKAQPARTILEEMEEQNLRAMKDLDELAKHYERERDRMAKLASDTRTGIEAIRAHQKVIDASKGPTVVESGK